MSTHLSAYCLKIMGIHTWNLQQTLPAAKNTNHYQICPLYKAHGEIAGNVWLETSEELLLTPAVWQLLDAMLTAINLSRTANTIVATEKPQPQIIMGEALAQRLLETTQPLDTLREKNIYVDQKKIPWLITYHPVDLLKNPKNKAKAWEDLKKIKLSF